MRYLRSVLTLAVAGAAVFLCACQEKAKPVPVYGLGEKVTVGHLVYTAFETRWQTQLGEGAGVRIPQNRFFIIHVTVTNSGGAPATVPNLVLEDDQGGTYTELSNGDQVSQWLGSLRQVAPADSIQGAVLFDVMPRRYRLRIFDENAAQSSLIDVPLNLNADTPSIPLPQGK